MAKVYLITEDQMESLRERLELSKHRQSDKRPADQIAVIEDCFRTFNFHVSSWINEVS